MNFVVVKNSTALLYRMGWNSPSCTIASNVASAIIQDRDHITVTHKDGRAVLYRITESRSSAYVVRSF